MVGGAFIPSAHVDDDYELDELTAGAHPDAHAVQWVGTPSVKGPKWARTPLLTVGMMGIQCVWSIENAYASPYLLELGLSKSFMSLVFMAGPLSGLIVQPLIGVLADRSTSRWGRRRPFMLAGCTICAIAILQLGWARTIAGWFGGGDGFAIAIAVWSIYLIDFSINAVMSTDRALVVDTLPPSQQEEGGAWAGRMFGFGSVTGFFVGNLDLPPVLPFLGKTQLQILSFITSAILMVAHGFTSWAVTERVLLRDDRPQSKNGLISSLKVIWQNMFSLPRGIRTVCIIQFFTSLGWFPVLFFTTVWVSDIYKTSQPDLDPSDPGVAADAVRAGARSLFFQSLVNIACSIALPFFVSGSGVQPVSGGYSAINGRGREEPRSALWKRAQEEITSGGWVRKTVGAVKGLVLRIRDGDGLGELLPIKGFTLVRVWMISQYTFAAAMVATWFVTSVSGAYFVIAVTGFCWALAQWAPYAILGELILLEGQHERDRERLMNASNPHLARTRPSLSERDEPTSNRISFDDPPHIMSTSTTSRPTPLHSRHGSRSDLARLDKQFKAEPSPLVPSTERISDEHEVSLVLHHQPDDDDDDDDDMHNGSDGYRSTSPNPPRGPGGAGKDTADKAGVILGIHNVFLVMPQFVVTIISAAIFHIMEPEKSLPGHPGHPGALPAGSVNGTITDFGATEAEGGVTDVIARYVFKREGAEMAGGSANAVGLIFLIGGTSAFVGATICMRLARSWRRGDGV